MKEKKNINLSNYEAYFLDYHEGSLSPNLVKELMDFIAKNPELREELESFEPITLKDTKINYSEKQALKKQLTGINPSNFDEYAIEYVEGTLSVGLQKELNAFIAQNPRYQKELELYSKTKLVPDSSIVFEDKSSLKRRNRRPAIYYYWSAAASVAIIIGTYFMLNKNVSSSENNTVKDNQIKDSNVVANNPSKTIDTTKIFSKSTYSNPHIYSVKNTPVVSINRHLQKEQENKKTLPDDPKKDSSALAVNKEANENPTEPVKKEILTPAHPANDTVASNSNSKDGDWQVIERPKEKKKGKLLIKLATLTCKGLHKITGQHIELEKHYGSDTTNITAYQLDLGNRKIQFPVKE